MEIRRVKFNNQTKLAFHLAGDPTAYAVDKTQVGYVEGQDTDISGFWLYRNENVHAWNVWMFVPCGKVTHGIIRADGTGNCEFERFQLTDGQERGNIQQA